MNFIQVFVTDLKRMVKSKLFLISVIAIIIVPVLYSLLYLKAFWDPYGSLDNLPVAVVNLDEGATLDGEEVNYGADVVDKLKTNDKVKWVFVSTEDEADAGLNGSKYYAKFQIDKDFSEKVIAAKSGTPEKAGMEFVCNQKKNYLASQVTSKVQSVLKEEIVSTITNNYVTASFDSLYEVKDGMISAADGSSKINDGIKELLAKVPELKDGVNQLQDGANQLYDGQSSLNNGLGQLNNGLYSLNEASPQLSNGSLSLYNGIGSLKDGLNTMNGGLAQLNEKVPGLSSGLGSLYSGSQSLKAGIDSAKSGSTELASGTKNLYNAYTTTVYPGVEQLNNGVKTLQSSIESGADSIKALQSGADTLNASSDAVKKASNDLKDGYSNIKSSVDQVVSASSSTEQVMKSIGEDLQSAMASTDDSTKNQKIMAVLQKMQQYQQASEGSAEKIKALSEGTAQFEKSYNEYNNKVSEYTEGVKNLSSGTSSLIGSVSQISSGVSQLSGGIDNLQKGLNTSFGPGLEKIAKGTSSLDGGLSQLQSGSNSLSNGLQTVNGSVPTLSSGISQLYEGSNSALVGADKLYAGASDLHNGIGTATSGIGQLYEGSNSALSGSNQLLTGTAKLKDGTNSLAAAVPTLQDGITKLSDGSGELAEKLQSGASDLSDGLVNSAQDMGDFVSDPVNLEIKPINEVDNYGSGFAPYFMNLSLWVGAIMMFFVIDPKARSKKETSKFNGVFGKFLTSAFAGTLQAILVGLAIYAIGLRPEHMVLYFAELIFFSLVYVVMVQCFITLFGDVGRLLSIVCLILQLTGCAGTFPLEMIPKIFNVINPYMPFTYGVEILREVCAADVVNYSIIGKDMAVLMIFLVVFLVATILLKNVGEKVLAWYEEKKENYMNYFDEK